MTARDKIIEMAREAGFDPHDMSADFTCNLKDLERFAALVRNAALEEAAVVCEAIGQDAKNALRSAYRTLAQGIERGTNDCANTIRNLKGTK